MGVLGCGNLLCHLGIDSHAPNNYWCCWPAIWALDNYMHQIHGVAVLFEALLRRDLGCGLALAAKDVSEVVAVTSYIGAKANNGRLDT